MPSSRLEVVPMLVEEIAELRKLAYEITGRGQFIPVAETGAVPHTGTPRTLERTEEIRIEIMCIGRKVTKAAVEGLTRTHRYEICAYEVYKIEDF